MHYYNDLSETPKVVYIKTNMFSDYNEFVHIQIYLSTELYDISRGMSRGLWDDKYHPTD